MSSAAPLAIVNLVTFTPRTAEPYAFTCVVRVLQEVMASGSSPQNLARVCLRLKELAPG